MAVLEEFGEEGEGEDGERRRKREVELMRVFEGVVSCEFFYFYFSFSLLSIQRRMLYGTR